MPEETTRFKTILLSDEIPKDKRIKKLIELGKKLSKRGLTPVYSYGAAGNLSFRTKNGFIITASGKDIGNLEKDEFSEVIECNINNNEVKARGKYKPSSESFMHYEVYRKRKDINAIIHAHSEEFLRNSDKLKAPITENEEPEGTVKLMKEVVRVLKKNDFILIKNHGFLCMGKDISAAADLIIEKSDQLNKSS